MFVLVQMKDTVRISPHLFHLDSMDAIRESLNVKFANKVVYNVGLCIALWDIEKVEDSYIFPGDGATHTNVHFRYVVFRPFVDEILVGRIKSCSKDGLHVSVGFFDDIVIPSDSLQHPSKFNEQEQLWSWEYEAPDEGSVDLPMDIGGDIRFRVVDETFVDTTPSCPDDTLSMPPPSSGPSSSTNPVPVSDPTAKKAPYTLVGSISEMGLGMLSWWKPG
ncbi:DNA-directed RNA polymerase III subunit RPC8 [Aplysia californica]|uniref:DNA-directed RNA polymerase III subunit RPC8 n=1 Tax=Aplysia californica TaxID=6500 RepID=A0ABM0JMQ7_APLCA|nr:DNA-directed RNA polymerase III subunit RPC8 [Aplysia californica]